MTDRFPPDVEAVLTAAGWRPGRKVDVSGALDCVETQVGRSGARTVSFPAADEALREFAGLAVVQDGPGVDVRRKPFLLDPESAAVTADTLADIGAAIGHALFPIGSEGDRDSILAIADDGAVYALDHTGEWCLGDTLDAALITLITGTLPLRLSA